MNNPNSNHVKIPPEVTEILKKIATAKGFAALIIVIIIGIFVWKNSDFLTEISFTIKPNHTETNTNVLNKSNEESTNTQTGVPALTIGRVILPPAPKKLPSIVVFEIKNSGSSEAKPVKIHLDLGAAKSIGYELIGAEDLNNKNSGNETSVLNIEAKEIGANESIYLYIQTTVPTFNKVTISSPNTINPTTYTYREYENENGANPEESGFSRFLWVIFGLFILVMSVYLTGVLIYHIHKRLILE